MFNRGTRLTKFLTDLSRILIIFLALSLSWNLTMLTGRIGLPDALGTDSEGVKSLLILIVAIICLYGYYYEDYIIIKFKIFIRGRMCKSQRSKTIIEILWLIFVFCVLFVFANEGSTMIDRIDVAATVSIATAALILQYSLLGDETKKEKEKNIKAYLHAITSRCKRIEKMSQNGVILVDNQDSMTHSSGQNTHVGWSFGYAEPAEASVLIVEIKISTDEKFENYKKSSITIEYAIMAGVRQLSCFLRYPMSRDGKCIIYTPFFVTVNYFYDYEWDRVISSLNKILDEITLDKELEMRRKG